MRVAWSAECRDAKCRVSWAYAERRLPQRLLIRTNLELRETMSAECRMLSAGCHGALLIDNKYDLRLTLKPSTFATHVQDT